MLNFKLFHNKIHSQLLEALLGRQDGTMALLTRLLLLLFEVQVQVVSRYYFLPITIHPPTHAQCVL